MQRIEPFTPSPSRNLHPADELYQVRKRIRDLRAREGDLRRDLLEGGDLVGREWQVVPTAQTSWRIDRHRLPGHILQNRSSLRCVRSTLLRIVPCGYQ